MKWTMRDKTTTRYFAKFFLDRLRIRAANFHRIVVFTFGVLFAIGQLTPQPLASLVGGVLAALLAWGWERSLMEAKGELE